MWGFGWVLWVWVWVWGGSDGEIGGGRKTGFVYMVRDVLVE